MTQITTRCDINILGPLSVVVDGHPIKPLRGKAVSGVLIALILAGERGRTADGLLRSLRDPKTGAQLVSSSNALEQHIRTLRGVGIPVPKLGRSHGAYRLDWPRMTVDASSFIESVDTAEPETVGSLLRLWREDPRPLYPQVPTEYWTPVFAARDVLVERLERTDPRTVLGLVEFADLFPDDPALDRLRRRARRKRLLVVEDQNIDQYLDALRSYYDCVPIRSLDEWHRFLRDNDDRVDVHGALVDLHLTTDLIDGHGLQIVDWLRDHTSLPASVMTMAPPPGNVEDWARTHRARHRLVQIVYKGTNEVDLPSIREAAAYLTGDEDHQVRARLATVLENAIFTADDRLAKQPRTKAVEDKRRELEKEAAVARRVVQEEELPRARKEVQDFRYRGRA
ncbi:hypothetical protein GCM10010182_80860 [Actinomadura cremea]|nr:hypothetical protein GCM10010182_80860 [Actinomadura cremea]